jgi:hypothetical protein
LAVTAHNRLIGQPIEVNSFGGLELPLAVVPALIQGKVSPVAPA